jgi:hypothetical protein
MDRIYREAEAVVGCRQKSFILVGDFFDASSIALILPILFIVLFY